jgi:CheY-like chemotaxis protein
VLSADATAQHVTQLLAAGVAAYLTKPIVIPELLGTLDRLL